MKKILKCEVQMHNGKWFTNELKLSEVRFVSQLAQENKQVIVTCVEVDEREFKLIFG